MALRDASASKNLLHIFVENNFLPDDDKCWCECVRVKRWRMQAATSTSTSGHKCGLADDLSQIFTNLRAQQSLL